MRLSANQEVPKDAARGQKQPLLPVGKRTLTPIFRTSNGRAEEARAAEEDQAAARTDRSAARDQATHGRSDDRCRARSSRALAAAITSPTTTRPADAGLVVHGRGLIAPIPFSSRSPGFS